jgi:NitT/TauT family transport system substrate-binding protein
VSRFRVPLSAVLAVAIIVAACAGGPSPSPTPSRPVPSVATAPVELTVGLGFIPSVQFAPFYRAQQAGYYADLGLDVTFENKIDPDLIALVGQGSLDLGMADGTSVIPAVSQGIPIRYVATVYARFPSIVFAAESAGIAGPADLAGRRLGIPGRFGSSWIMLQALLDSVGLTPDDLEIVEYPDFGQGAAVAAGAVDAATGFANNEPIQLELTGQPAVVLRIDEITPLPGPGLIAGQTILTEQPDAVRSFVAATLRAIEEIADDPEVGLAAAFEAVPELASAEDAQRAILLATVEMWRSPIVEADGWGAIDLDGWARSLAYLESLGLVPQPVTVEQLVADDFRSIRP